MRLFVSIVALGFALVTSVLAASGLRIVRTSGVSLRVPGGWHTTLAKAPWCDPERLVTASSGQLRISRSGTLAPPRAHQVLVLLLEDHLRRDRPSGNLRRPVHFSVSWNRLVHLKGGCGLPNAAAYMRYFKAHGRYLGFIIYPGPAVAARTKAETLSVLDSLRVRG
jgi:hypothetical protein